MADEYIRLDTTIIAIDRLINEAATGTMARTLFKAKDTLYSQQRYVIDVQPVKRGQWKYYKNTGIFDIHKCSVCATPFELSMGIVPSSVFCFCPHCGARMIKDGDTDA